MGLFQLLLNAESLIKDFFWGAVLFKNGGISG